MLTSFSTLDLTDKNCHLCGNILVDLGCEVIKVERVGGDASRNFGPFYKDSPDPERSLSWFAYNAGKKGITLNIETADGGELFKKLAKQSDIILESFPLGYLDGLGLGYSVLSEINPKIILTSITPFGQSGPYAQYKGADIVAMGMSGALYLTGNPDGPPMRMNLPKTHLTAATDAAAATLIALYYREMSGEGQHIDVSVQASEVLDTANAVPFWEAERKIQLRAGHYRSGLSVGAKQRQTWPCKDGFISLSIFGGRIGAKTNKALIQWMDSEGAADETLKSIDWDNFDMAVPNPEMHYHTEKMLINFFKDRGKLELYEEAKKRRIMLYPVSTIGEVVQSPQLKARDFWQAEEHPELGVTINVPGAFIKSSEAPSENRKRAPLIGEHNDEIFVRRLGLSRDQLLVLKQRNVI